MTNERHKQQNFLGYAALGVFAVLGVLFLGSSPAPARYDESPGPRPIVPLYSADADAKPVSTDNVDSGIRVEGENHGIVVNGNLERHIHVHDVERVVETKIVEIETPIVQTVYVERPSRQPEVRIRNLDCEERAATHRRIVANWLGEFQPE